MSERFEVLHKDYPSKEARTAYCRANPEGVVSPSGLYAAYAVDVPALCRAECLALIDALLPLDKSKYREAMAWVQSRFPEAAPKRVYPCNEPECVKCRTYEGHPTPSASAESECDAARVEFRLCAGEQIVGETFHLRRTLHLPHPRFGWSMRGCTIRSTARLDMLVDGTDRDGFTGTYPFGGNILRNGTVDLSSGPFRAAPPSEAPAQGASYKGERCKEWQGMCGKREGHRGAHGLDESPWDFPPEPVAAARPEAEQCDEEGPQGHPPHPQWASPLCTKPKGHAGPHQRYEGKPWPNTSCTACACPDCTTDRKVLRSSVSLTEAERAFLRELAKLSSLASLGRYPDEALVRAAAKVSE